MPSHDTVLVEMTHECVRALRSEISHRMLNGGLEADDIVALVDAAMGRLMGRLGELTGPEIVVETFFPVMLTLLFEAVLRPHNLATPGGPN